MRKIIFFSMLFVLTLASLSLEAKAQFASVATKNKDPDVFANRQKFEYHGSYEGDGLPTKKGLTRAEIDELLNRGHYNWMGIFYSPSVLDPQEYSVRSLADTLGEKLIEAQYLSEVLGLKIEREDYDQQKGKISLETNRLTLAISQNIAKASGISVNDTLSTTDVPGRIKAMEGYVDGIWLEHHGFNGIRVKIKLDNMSQRWVMYHLDGSPVRDFEYVAATGNIGGAQTKDTIKVYAVAFAKDSSSYCILTCPDVEASPVIDGMREINLSPVITNLVEGAAVSILGNPPFSLRDEAINRLFAPSMTTIAQGGGQ